LFSAVNQLWTICARLSALGILGSLNSFSSLMRTTFHKDQKRAKSARLTTYNVFRRIHNSEDGDGSYNFIKIKKGSTVAATQ
jgi:hypothetical protein